MFTGIGMNVILEYYQLLVVNGSTTIRVRKIVNLYMEPDVCASTWA
jgi:hypothetical protein